MNNGVLFRSFIQGRKGKESVADSLIHALWDPINSDSATRTIHDLQCEASVRLGFNVEAATVRSTLYRHPEIFERLASGKRPALYCLAASFLENIHEK